MVDIDCATAEIRQGQKEEDRKKKPQGKNKNIMSASATHGGHNKNVLKMLKNVTKMKKTLKTLKNVTHANSLINSTV